MNRIIILGSTGNVGTQVLQVAGKYPRKIKIAGLAANNNSSLLLRQIKKYRPQAVAIPNEIKAQKIRIKVKIPVFSGKDALEKLAGMKDYDTLVNAVVGLAGIRATLSAIRQRKNIALANKEALVAAGEIIMREVKKHHVRLMPIDSEHSALFQCLQGENQSEIHRLILTCSGGSLRKKTAKQMAKTTVREALGHATWNMGDKITIDSATLMNKGFEIIEAMHLYGVPVEKISVVVHPQSIIHSMVEYSDASIIAQLSNPDMKLPIQYALSYPERWLPPIKRFNFSKNLTFEKPDLEKFPCLKYAFEAAKKGGTLPAAMNAANDYMVREFLGGRCQITDIPRIIRKVMRQHVLIKNPTLEEIEASIEKATKAAEKYFSKKRWYNIKESWKQPMRQQ